MREAMPSLTNRFAQSFCAAAVLAVFINISAPGLAQAKKSGPEPATDTGEAVKRADEKKETAAPVEGDDQDLLEKKKGVEFKFKGQAKNLYTFHRTNNYTGANRITGSSKNLSADLTRVRLTPELLYKDILDIKIDYDNELIGSNYGSSTYFKNFWRPSQYNDLLHISWEPYRSDELLYRTKLHRAYVKVNVDKFSATVGRQQIRFGSGKLWNPLDILNPVSPTLVEGGDEQKGTDALRMDVYPDEKSEITMVVDFKKSNNKIGHFNMRDQNYILRIKTSVSDVDIALLGGYVSRRGVAGFDFAAILFDGMFRGSMIVSQASEPYVTNTSDISKIYRSLIPGRVGNQPVFIQANVGYEYNFKQGVYLLVEYFFNQKGLNYNRDIKAAAFVSQLNAMDQKTYLQIANQFLTVNQHYVAVALGYDFHPLVRGELFTIGDIQGQGIFWGPTLRVNAYENLDFTVGMMGGFNFNKKSSDFSEFRKNYLFYCSGSYVFGI